jgi:hypothetical protein
VCGTECDLEVRSFKDVYDVRGFSADVCKIGPFLCGVGGYEFIWVEGWWFMWFYWEGVTVKDVMYYVLLLLIFPLL